MSAMGDGVSGLAALRNVGPATLADFRLIGIATVAQLAASDADALYLSVCARSGVRHDPCAHDVFAAAIHEAQTGDARDWWSFTPARKARQKSGEVPAVGHDGRAERPA